MRDAEGRRLTSVVEMLARARPARHRRAGACSVSAHCASTSATTRSSCRDCSAASSSAAAISTTISRKASVPTRAVSELDVSLYRPGFLMFEELSKRFENYSGALDYMRKCYLRARAQRGSVRRLRATRLKAGCGAPDAPIDCRPTDASADARERLDRYLVRLGWARSRRAAARDARRRPGPRQRPRFRKGETVGGGDAVEIARASRAARARTRPQVKLEVLFRGPRDAGRQQARADAVSSAAPRRARHGDERRRRRISRDRRRRATIRAKAAWSIGSTTAPRARCWWRCNRRPSRRCARRFAPAGYAAITRRWSRVILKNHFRLDKSLDARPAQSAPHDA